MNTQLDENAKQARREYQKNWRKANKEKVKAYNAKYWQKYAERKKQKVGEGE